MIQQFPKNLVIARLDRHKNHGLNYLMIIIKKKFDCQIISQCFCSYKQLNQPKNKMKFILQATLLLELLFTNQIHGLDNDNLDNDNFVVDEDDFDASSTIVNSTTVNNTTINVFHFEFEFYIIKPEQEGEWEEEQEEWDEEQDQEQEEEQEPSEESEMVPSKEFVIALSQRNIDLLTEFVNNVSNPDSEFYGLYLQSPLIIQTLVQPEWELVEPVYDWLHNHDIKILSDFGDSLLCVGSIENVNQLFNVQLDQVSDGGHYLAATDYTIPDHLSDVIEFVDGISNQNVIKRSYVKKGYADMTCDNPLSTAPPADDNYCGKEVIDRLYNVTDVVNVSNGISIGSIEYQGQSGFSQDDLSTAQKFNQVPEKNVTHVIGNDGYPDDESQLDMQMMGINVPGADIWFWDGDKWLYSLAVKMVNAGEVPDVISMSWGWSESDQCSICNCSGKTSHQYVNRVNNEYLKLAARGISMMVSSGDAGAPGRTNEDCMDMDPTNTVHATFPGSSHWVTSVGATYIVNPNPNNTNMTKGGTTPLCKQFGCATGTSEFVTNNNATGWTAGGGINNYTNRSGQAKWQDEAVTSYLNSGVPLPTNFNRNGRAYPDVSVVGHYCPVMGGESPEPIDGTSCSSPIFASIVTLLNDHQVRNGKPKLGFVNPVLYKMYKDNPAIFRDGEKGDNWSTEYATCAVRKDGGSNFGYKATKGFDPVYGLGMPNVGLMKEWLDKNTKTLDLWEIEDLIQYM